MFSGLLKYKYWAIFLWILIGCIFDSVAFHYKAYTLAEWIRIGIIVLVIIIIISPSKYQVIIIGTLLGCTATYFAYSYLLPFVLIALSSS